MSDVRVDLRAARIPIIGWLAHHHWFVVDRDGQQERWEVWQRANAGGESWGHVHRNLLPPAQGVGNGPSWIVHSWDGADGVALSERLTRCCDEYPWCGRYRYWPGPNSNTFAQWVLGARLSLPGRALGKRYARRRRA